MKYTVAFLLLLPLLLAPIAGAEAGQRKRIAVAEPQARGGLTTEEIGGISNYLEAKLAPQYEIFSRSALRQILAEYEFNNSGLVADDERKNELRQQSVDYLFAYTVSRIGSLLSMTMFVVDAETGRLLPEKRAAVEGRTLDELFRRIDTGLLKMGMLQLPDAERKSIALLPTAGQPAAGASAFYDRLNEFLVKTDAYDIYSRKDLQKIAAESAIAESALADPGQWSRIGRLKTVDYLVVTELSRFEQTAKQAGTAISGVSAPKYQMRGDLTLRLVEVATGKVLAAETVKCFFESTEIPAEERRNWNSGDYDRELAARLALNAGSALLDRLDPMLVAQLEGKEVYLTRGEGSGVAVGAIYQLFRPGKEIVHPKTGRKLGSTEKLLGELRITRVTPDSSVGELLPGSEPVEPGAICRLKQEAAGENSAPPAYPLAQ